MDVNQYLDRLGAAERQQPSLSYLERLQTLHVRNIPFENLDIMRKIPLSMEPDHLERKIVQNRRGGVCYELNGLFNHLLRELGFDAYWAAATTRLQDRWNPNEYTHMLNIVNVDGRRYIADVGFGGNSPGKPVPLDGEEVRDTDGWYRVVEEEGILVLQKREADEWQPLYRFQPDEKQPEDFAPWCDYVQHGPDSPFNQRLFVTRAAERGRVTLAGNSLTVVEDGEKRKVELQEDEIPHALQQWFELEV